jgi:hypothetical protein
MPKEIHQDQTDRTMLTGVPTEPVTNAEKAQVYRFNQFLHTLKNLAEISKGGEIIK